MAEPSDAGFECPACGKHYQWKSAWADKKVKCECGTKLKLPPQPGGEVVALDGPIASLAESTPAPVVEPGDGYELNVDDQTPAEETGPPEKPATSGSEAADAELNPYELDLDDHEGEDAAAGQAVSTGVSPKPSEARDHSAGGQSCPQCGSKMRSGAVVCVQCGYHLEKGEAIDTKIATEPAAVDTSSESRSLVEQQANPQEPAYVNEAIKAARRAEARRAAQEQEYAAHYRRIDVKYPLIMLASGPAIILIMSLLIERSLSKGLETAGLVAAGELIVMGPLLFISVLIGAALLKMQFGTLGKVLFKCAAISVGPGTLGDLLAVPMAAVLMGPIGLAFGMFFLYLLFIGWPMSKLFDLDMQEAMAMVTIVIVVRLAAIVMFAVFLYRYW